MSQAAIGRARGRRPTMTWPSIEMAIRMKAMKTILAWGTRVKVFEPKRRVRGVDRKAKVMGASVYLCVRIKTGS